MFCGLQKHSNYRIVVQVKIFKVKIFKVIHKSVKSVKFFSLKIFRLYGIWSGFLIDYDMVLAFSMPVNLKSGEVESCAESDNI